MRDLCSDSLWQCVCHRSVVKGTKQTPATIHFQVTRRPNYRSSNIHGEYGIVSGDFIEDSGDVLRMNRALAGLSCCQIVESFARFAVMVATGIEVGAVGFLIDTWKQCGERLRGASCNTEVQVASSPQLFLADIDLQNAGILGIKLLVGEISSQHQQSITIHHGVIARSESKQAGHAYVVGIVVLDELFSPHGVHNWRLELRCQLDQLIMSACTTCAGQDCHSRRAIKFDRQLIQLFRTGDNVRLSKREIDTAIVIFRIQ